MAAKFKTKTKAKMELVAGGRRQQQTKRGALKDVAGIGLKRGTAIGIKYAPLACQRLVIKT